MIESAERTTTAPTDRLRAQARVAPLGEIMAVVALVLGVVSMLIGPNWTLLWVASVLLVLALTTGAVMRRLRYGRP